MTREHFDGEIFGIGSTSGVRVVIGNWAESPFGRFADAMVEDADGRRTLVAPTQAVADYVSETYNFDSIAIAATVVTRTPSMLTFASEPLHIVVGVGRRTKLGTLLRLVPKRLSSAPWWATAIDPIARIVMPGVRTRGEAGHDRREWYGAADMHALTTLEGVFEGICMGVLADVDPPVRFGFASTPPRPAVVSLRTTISRTRRVHERR